MKIVCCWLLIVWACRGCDCDDDLFPTSTVDLVSVLRRDLVTNNDDFTAPAPARRSQYLLAAPAPARRSQYLPAAPAPARRSQYLPAADKLTRPTNPPDGIQYPKQQITRSYSSTTTEHTTKVAAQTRTRQNNYFMRYQTGGRDPGWRRINNNIKTTKKDKNAFRKSVYLQPNKLIVNSMPNISIYRQSNTLSKTIASKSVTDTTTEGVKIFYETLTKHHKTNTKAVTQLKATKASDVKDIIHIHETNTAELVPRLRAIKDSKGTIQQQYSFENRKSQRTTYHGLVGDKNGLLAMYTPFTGKKFEQVNEYMVTKFFEFKAAPRNLRGTTTTPYSTEFLENLSAGKPNPFILDIAPAKGSVVDMARQKLNLCDRNIMSVQGPKYNKYGSTVTAWHYREDFDHTKMRRIVVPRCCNCCKKSVLGCQ